MRESVLVIGGAGYIGSHAAKLLASRGHTPVILDDLSTGHRAAAQNFTLHVHSYADGTAVERVLRDHKIATVMHFGAKALVDESMRDPLLYYQANVAGTVELLKAMLRAGTRRFIFSSTCATFGIPEKLPIVETTPQNPINPYGMSKLFVEKILRDLDRTHGLRFGILRYFNAAGADPEGKLGEHHEIETHLIPRALAVAAGHDAKLRVNGNDYPTPDGSCVRDYVHVNDLGQAHILAMERLMSRDESFDANLGTGHGYSVFQVINAIERATGRKLPYEVGARRPGDPPVLVADPTKARELLGWSPAHDLSSIVTTAWRWFEANPHGYQKS